MYDSYVVVVVYLHGHDGWWLLFHLLAIAIVQQDDVVRGRDDGDGLRRI